MNRNIEFPAASEYPSYAEMYMKWVKKDGTLLLQLEESLEKTKKLVKSLSAEELEFKYEPNKWTVQEVLVHIVDDERIYAYRAMAFARGDKTELPGFDQDLYAANSYASKRSIESILEEYEMVRKSTISLFKGFSNTVLTEIGKANGNFTSVRALGYHILGHELHHIQSIENVYLKEFRRSIKNTL